MTLTARERLALWLYRAILYVGGPLLVAPYLGYRLVRNKPFVDIRRRLGWGANDDGHAGGAIWVHAVSVGEVVAARILAAALRAKFPMLAIRLTATTTTGLVQAELAQAAGEVDQAAPSPIDLPGAVRRHLERVQPLLLVLMEAEIWPNWLHAASCRGVPVALVNARISERSTRRYHAFRALFAPALRSFAVVAARSDDDFERLRRLGVDPNRMIVTGDVKIDSADPAWDRARARRELRLPADVPVIVAGSTHAGEDAWVVEAFRRCQSRDPLVTLVLAPRKSLHANLERHVVVSRSSGQSTPPGAILLLDSIGELRDSYAAGDVAFVGGSLVTTGGHNLLEPAVAGVPVLFGPHTYHHANAAHRLLASGGGRRVGDVDQLAQAFADWLSDAAARRVAGLAARRVVDDGRGATRQIVELLRPLIESRSADR